MQISTENTCFARVRHAARALRRHHDLHRDACMHKRVTLMATVIHFYLAFAVNHHIDDGALFAVGHSYKNTPTAFYEILF